MAVKDWDEIADTLFQFIRNHIPLSGLSLIIYNQSSEKYEIVDEGLLDREIEPAVHSLPLIHCGKEIARLNLYTHPDASCPAAVIEMIQNLVPEVAMAIERISSFRSLYENSLAIQKSERNRIARHLHDTLGHDLTYLCLKLDHLSSSPDQMNGLAKFHSEIESLHGIAIDAVDHVRNLLSELQDENPGNPSSDLVFDVKECALLIGARANFQVNIKISGDPKILLPQMHRQVLYLVREILRNVEKHAHAQNVTLAIDWLNNGLIIKISDDGQGFDFNVSQKKDGHIGLRTVQEIVQELNGSLSMVSNPGEDTQITIWLPYN
jgi:signal transduction histidine kinase